MKSYKAIRAQIAKLEQQAETLRQTQVKAVIAQLKKTIDEYGLTAEELGLGAVKAKAKAKALRGVRKAAGTRKSVGAAKYRDPKSGQTWTGRGRPPAWIANVKDRDAFLIGAAPAAPAATPEAQPAAAKRGKAAKPSKSAPKPAAKGAPGRKATAKKTRKPRAAVKTPAVQIESGVAME